MKNITNEQIFLRVVETGSFKAAAQSLSMDPSLLSRRVSSLEKRLQVKLIQRSTKTSHPTEQGFLYFRGLKTLVEEQQSLENTICGMTNKPSGHLKIAAPHDFGVAFVAPVLEDMLKQYDDLSAELVLGSQYENLSTQGIDVALRIGELKDSSLVCRRIGDVPRVLVASPSYIKKYGMPSCVEDLAKHEFIFFAKAHINTPIKIGTRSIKIGGRFVANSVSAIRQLVLQDRGMHIGPLWAFKHEIEQRRLVSVLPQERFASLPLHALYLSRSYLPAKIRMFIDLLVERYGTTTFF